MITIITIIHVLACLFLIVVVLLQHGKGADMGAVFGGGGSATIFGASGAGNFLTKLTTATAIIFFLTSLVLAYGSLSRSRATVFDQPLPEPPPPMNSAGAPAAPGEAPPAASAPGTTSGESPAPQGGSNPEAPSPSNP